MTASIAVLREPVHFKLSGKKAPNRLYKSAQSEYACTYSEQDRSACGIPTAKYVEYYQELAEGGAGIICSGNIPIDREYLESGGNAVLDYQNPWSAVEAFRPAIEAAQSGGGLFLAQLQHPGRQSPDYITSEPRSASDVQLCPAMGKEYCRPTPLRLDEIEDLKRRYVWAASQLAQAGADGIILHGCHGYLLSQFLSPLTNKRKDKYGGSLENRARFILELVHSIKEAMPTDKFIIGVKYNCHDFIAGGTTFAQASVVMRWLEEAGVDFFDISGGTYESPAWRGNIMKNLTKRPSRQEWGSYFLEWAQELTGITSRAIVGTTGGWRNADLMARAVAEGRVHMCGIARPLKEEPDLVRRMLDGSVRQSHL